MQLSLFFVLSALAVASSAFACSDAGHDHVDHHRHHHHQHEHRHRHHHHGGQKHHHKDHSKHPTPSSHSDSPVHSQSRPPRSSGFSQVPIAGTQKTVTPPTPPAASASSQASRASPASYHSVPASYSSAPASHRSTPASASTSQPSLPAPSSTAPVSASEADRWLAAHNVWRKEYTVAPLTWNASLLPAAEGMVKSCVFKHTSNKGDGQNIAAGFHDLEGVVTAWVNGSNAKTERWAYDPNGNTYSHFTQIVWAGTQEIGCASYKCPQGEFYACEYHPPGNVIGAFKENVHALKGGAPS